MKSFMLIFSFVVFSTYADVGQHLLDEIDNDYQSNMNNDFSHPMVPGADQKEIEVTEEDIEKYKKMQGEIEDEDYLKSSESEKILHSFTAAGTQSSAYIENDNEKLLEQKRNLGSNSFTISYTFDTYDYKNGKNTFEKIYREETKYPRSDKNGILRFTGINYLSRRFIDLTVGVALGVGYNGGQAVFADGTVGDTKFSLWTIPLDLPIGFEVNLTKYFKLGGYIAPSIMGLIQTRSDKDAEDANKQVLQYSPGYAATGLLRASLSEMFSKSAFEMLYQYDVTKVYLSLEFRTQRYAQFGDPNVEISGTALSLGFNVEYY